jgi:hypothetical protein
LTSHVFTCGFHKYPFHRSTVALYIIVAEECCVSPILVNLYNEYLIKEDLEGFGDCKIRGQVIRTVKYTDDVVLVAKES